MYLHKEDSDNIFYETVKLNYIELVRSILR